MEVKEICKEQEKEQAEIERIAVQKREAIEDFEFRVHKCVERAE